MERQRFAPIAQAEKRRFAPGETAQPEQFSPGDFILTHSNSFYGWLIRFGQRLRFRGEDRKYGWWNHAAVIVSTDGDLIEALNAGVRRTNTTTYALTDYTLVHLQPSLADEHDRKQIVAFANWCLGQPYGWFTIASIAFSLITGGKFTFGFEGQSICSGLVARSLERTSAIFNRTPSHIMPADLAKYFQVEPPPPGSIIGTPPPPPPKFRHASQPN
jgi:uncharacterized protein YycO